MRVFFAIVLAWCFVSIVSGSVASNPNIVNHTDNNIGSKKRSNRPLIFGKSLSLSKKLRKNSQAHGKQNLKAHLSSVRPEFLSEVRKYVNSISNSVLPIPLSQEEDDHLLHEIRLRTEILRRETMMFRESATAINEATIAQHFWVSAFMQFALGLAAIGIAVGFIIGAINSGRGKESAYKDLKKWFKRSSGRIHSTATFIFLIY